VANYDSPLLQHDAIAGDQQAVRDEMADYPWAAQREDFAARLREAWAKCRAAIQLSISSRNVADKTPVAEWFLAADWVLRHGCYDPEGYVEAQFTSETKRVPYTNQLRSAAAVARYRKHQDTLVLRIRHALLGETGRLQIAIARARSHKPHASAAEVQEAALFTTAVSLSPLFRYSVAVAEGHVAVAAAYRVDAIRQLLVAPAAYAKYWSALLSAELLREVRLHIGEGV